MENVINEYCSQCEDEVTLENIFEVQQCPTCGEKILPCSICVISNCEECPLENITLEERYALRVNNNVLNKSSLRAVIIETSERYGEYDCDVCEDDPFFMAAMYEGYIEDDWGNEIDDTRTGRYCCLKSVSDELESFAYDLIEQG